MNPQKNLFLGCVLSMCFVLVPVALHAWVGPVSAPPADNASAPVNVGATSQVKSGGLWVGSFGVDGGASFGGSVGIGTVTPGALLEVNSVSQANTATPAMKIATYGVSNTSNSAIKFTNSATTQTWTLDNPYDGSFRLSRSGDSTNSSWPIYVSSTGNIGFGTGSTNYRLNIAPGGQNALYFGNVSYTPTRPSSGALLYADAGEIRAQDASGNLTVLSPHNFSQIPGGASENMAWAYYSEKEMPDGVYAINVDMTHALRLLESLTGEKLVYISKDGIDDGATPSSSLIDDLYAKNAKLEAEVDALKAAIAELQAR